jgi:hypothetical protein
MSIYDSPLFKKWQDEETEKMYEGNCARAIAEKSVFVLLIIPQNIVIGTYDPEWASLLQHDDGSNRTIVFQQREDAFRFGIKYIDDPWQVVEL